MRVWHWSRVTRTHIRWGASVCAQVRFVDTVRPRQRLRPTDPFAASLFDETSADVPSSSGESAVPTDIDALRVFNSQAASFAGISSPVALRQRYPDSQVTSEAVEALDARVRARIEAQQEALSEVSTDELTARVQHYLNATRHVRLVSAEEEHVLFPVVNHRLHELTVDQMLDIVSSHWSRSTLMRYGTALKDRVRDRLATIAVHAGRQLQQKGAPSTSVSDVTDGNEPTAAVDGTHDEEGAVKASGDGDPQEVHDDPILATAAAAMDAPTVLRCLVVMGLSAGHRKRDVAFFQVIGSFVVFHINRYQNSHDLVRALTALSRAKIVPPESFLSLIARRLPVVHKKSPLTPLSAYRVMVNLSKMGYRQMNAYRFLADVMLRAMQESRVSVSSNTSPSSQATSSVSIKALDAHELERVTGLKPSMFTKWLAVLGLTGAPHQQYLRPLVAPIIVPALPHLPPPSFSRLLIAIYRFRSTDKDLLEPLLEYVTVVMAPAGHLRRADALTLLRVLTVLAEEEAPPANVAAFFTAMHTTFSATTGPSQESSRTDVYGAQAPMRPRDMCVVAQCVARYQVRTGLPFEALTPLLELLEDFAEQLCVWTDLGVVSLVHIDQFLALCVQEVQHPDAKGHLARLQTARQRLAASNDDFDKGTSDDVAAHAGTGDVSSYDEKLDVDVREVFESLTIINDPATAYGGYKPILGPLLVDFRELLARCTALDVLEAVDLFERSCPRALGKGAKLLLTRSVLAKLTYAGEEVLTHDSRELVLRAPQTLVLTRDDVTRLAVLLRRCPLEKVRDSEAVWATVRAKASQLGMPAVVGAEETEASRRDSGSTP